MCWDMGITTVAGGWEGYNGLLPGQVLSVLGMDTAVKEKCHEYHHLFEKFEKNRQPQPGYRVCLLLLYCIVSCLSIVFSDFTIKNTDISI